MKLTIAAVAAVLICLCSLAARSMAIRAAAQSAPENVCLQQERLALAAIDGRLASRLQKLAKR